MKGVCGMSFATGSCDEIAKELFKEVRNCEVMYEDPRLGWVPTNVVVMTVATAQKFADGERLIFRVATVGEQNIGFMVSVVKDEAELEKRMAMLETLGMVKQ